jgi:hypothetical protein
MVTRYGYHRDGYGPHSCRRASFGIFQGERGILTREVLERIVYDQTNKQTKNTRTAAAVVLVCKFDEEISRFNRDRQGQKCKKLNIQRRLRRSLSLSLNH